MIKIKEIIKRVDNIYYLFDGIILILIFFGFFILNSKSIFYDLIFQGAGKGLFLPVWWIYIIVSCSLFLVLRKFYMEKSCIKIGIYIFLVAFMLRVIVCSLNLYVPIDDFKNYYDMGANLYFGNYDKVESIISGYGLPKLGGLAVFNSIIARLFSTTVFGLQVSNCFMNALTCVVLFNIFRIKSVKLGAITGFLYAIYPANIFSTVVTANVHGAIFFSYFGLLLAVYAYKNLENTKSFIFSALSMIMFTISGFFHPMAHYCFLLALIFISVLIQIRGFIVKNNTTKKLWICLIIILAGVNCFTSIGLVALQNEGIISMEEKQPLLTSLLVGLNVKDEGALGKNVRNDIKEVKQLDDKDKNAVIIQKIKTNMESPKALVQLFLKKEDRIWFSSDTWDGWYIKGKIMQYNKLKESNQISDEQQLTLNKLNTILGVGIRLDFMFVHIIYLISAIGLLFRKKDKLDSVINLPIIVILGWIFAFLLIEVQSRYRCYAMPMFMCLAAVGICLIPEVYNKAKSTLFEQLAVKRGRKI
jgi:hypothetical protein